MWRGGRPHLCPGWARSSAGTWPVEADIGDKVPTHAQHGGQHVLGGDVTPADLGQHLQVGGAAEGDSPESSLPLTGTLSGHRAWG